MVTIGFSSIFSLFFGIWLALIILVIFPHHLLKLRPLNDNDLLIQRIHRWVGGAASRKIHLTLFELVIQTTIIFFATVVLRGTRND